MLHVSNLSCNVAKSRGSFSVTFLATRNATIAVAKWDVTRDFYFLATCITWRVTWPLIWDFLHKSVGFNLSSVIQIILWFLNYVWLSKKAKTLHFSCKDERNWCTILQPCSQGFSHPFKLQMENPWPTPQIVVAPNPLSSSPFWNRMTHVTISRNKFVTRNEALLVCYILLAVCYIHVRRPKWVDRKMCWRLLSFKVVLLVT